jgi:hypothetical protein
MPDFGIFRGFNEKLFGDKLYAGQLPINLGNNSDPDAVAFFERVTAAGGTLSATEQLAIDTLVKQMKSDGIWTKMKAIYPMVGASAQACAQNLKSSSFTGRFNGGWTFASTGATPNGTTGYFDTNATISSFTKTNIHFSYYSRTNSAAPFQFTTEIGVGNGAVALAFYELNIRRQNGNFSGNLSDNFTNSFSITNLNSQGHYIVNRTSSNVLNGWKNGSKLITNTATALFVNTPTNNILIAASKDGTSPIGNFSNRQCALASLGDGLNDTEASDFYNAVQAFQTTLSRNV